MTTWQRGREVVTRERERAEGPLRAFVDQLHTCQPPLLRVAGTALFGAFVAVLLVELTATFTGANLRFTIVVAALIGWLAAALPLAQRPGEASQLTAGSR